MNSPALSAAPAPASPRRPAAASPAMREALEAVHDVGPTPTTVLLLGESGTGKELVARLIHAESGRTGPWVAVNCAALPAELLESELFGHERGAFTGASERHAGRFEQAHRGTLLLDEVSELPLPLQAKLLRVLQEREVDRLGGQRPVPVDVRVVATTNRDLAEMVRRGRFRSDLYYRLNVFPIVLPPLRERPEDLPLLAAEILEETALELGRPVPQLDGAALELLGQHPFPGNVRELRNLLSRALVRCRGGVVGAAHLSLSLVTPVAPGPAAGTRAMADPGELSSPYPDDERARSPSYPPGLPLDLAELERLAVAEALRRMSGNRTHAARLLGIGLRTLRNKLRAYRETGVEVEPAGAADGQDWPGGTDEPPGISQSWHGALRARASHGEDS